MTNGVTFTPLSRSLRAIIQGSLSQDSRPSVINMMKFLAKVSGKSAAAASRDLAIGVAPFACKPLIFILMGSMLFGAKGTSSLVS